MGYFIREWFQWLSNDSLHVSSDFLEFHKHLNQNRNTPNLLAQIKLSIGSLWSPLLFPRRRTIVFWSASFASLVFIQYDELLWRKHSWWAIFDQYSNHSNVENRKCLGTAHANDFLAKNSSKVVCKNHETYGAWRRNSVISSQFLVH